MQATADSGYYYALFLSLKTENCNMWQGFYTFDILNNSDKDLKQGDEILTQASSDFKILKIIL